MLVTKELLERCINNDRKAQQEFYKAYYSFIMGICYRYYSSKDEMFIAHNESFLKIMMNLKSYKGDAPFEVWIRRITINTIMDSFRRTKKLRETIEFKDMAAPDFIEAPQEGNKNEAEWSLEVEDLYKLIHLLPPMCKKVFNLYVVDGYQHKEIAKMLGVSEGTSKSQLFDARKKLQKMIADYHTPKVAKNE